MNSEVKAPGCSGPSLKVGDPQHWNPHGFWVFLKIRVTPKMDGEHKGKPYYYYYFFFWVGKFPHYFWGNIHTPTTCIHKIFQIDIPIGGLKWRFKCKWIPPFWYHKMWDQQPWKSLATIFFFDRLVFKTTIVLIWVYHHPKWSTIFLNGVDLQQKTPKNMRNMLFG